MAKTVTFNVKNLKKKLSLYEETQANFAGKKALTKFGKRIKGREGIIAKKYKLMFSSPVFFTLNSTFTVQRGLELDVGVKDAKALKSGKGNPASKYLYPAIGGGSTKAYDTLFTQYLRNRNLINNGDYPFAVIGNRFIKTNKRGRVTKSTYSNTMIGLAKTRDKEIKSRSRVNSKIQDARVIAFASDTGKYRKGIYREQTPSKGKFKSFLKPLFMFKPIPTQRPKQTFSSIVGGASKKLIPEMWLKEIQELAK